MSIDIVLATFNARYTHASLGLRYLRANLGALRERSVIVEATLATSPWSMADRILALAPKIVGIGVYIWNARESQQLVRMLKQVAPQIVVIVGGPEVSHETEAQAMFPWVDHVVRGEGDLAFARLCEHVLAPRRLAMLPPKIVDGGTPDLATLALPYDEYSDEDLRDRTVYIEASRGCPFRCAFCLSALDRGVRAFPREHFHAALDDLYRRGLRRFKFVDRTFNLAIDDATAILRFFLERDHDALFLHFEMIPDRLPGELLELLTRFPSGAVQLEVGFQTFDPEVARRIERRTQRDRALENLRRLRETTGVHVHADLIAGLPGESWETFGAGFDTLVAAGPQEIQLGVLKRLRGAPLATSPHTEGFIFDDQPPYEVLQTPTWTFARLAELRRVAWVWDRVFNQGRAPQCAALLLEAWAARGSVFEGLADFAATVVAKEPVLHGVPWERWLRHMYEHLCALGIDPTLALAAAQQDARKVRLPSFAPTSEASVRDPRPAQGPPPRQRRHLEGPAAESDDAPRPGQVPRVRAHGRITT